MKRMRSWIGIGVFLRKEAREKLLLTVRRVAFAQCRSEGGPQTVAAVLVGD